ncbi:hypothetical protein LXL04_020397 [Taraxacum kok-saghyz]
MYVINKCHGLNQDDERVKQEPSISPVFKSSCPYQTPRALEVSREIDDEVESRVDKFRFKTGVGYRFLQISLIVLSGEARIGSQGYSFPRQIKGYSHGRPSICVAPVIEVAALASGFIGKVHDCYFVIINPKDSDVQSKSLLQGAVVKTLAEETFPCGPKDGKT